MCVCFSLFKSLLLSLYYAFPFPFDACKLFYNEIYQRGDFGFFLLIIITHLCYRFFKNCPRIVNYNWKCLMHFLVVVVVACRSEARAKKSGNREKEQKCKTFLLTGKCNLMTWNFFLHHYFSSWNCISLKSAHRWSERTHKVFFLSPTLQIHFVCLKESQIARATFSCQYHYECEGQWCDIQWKFLTQFLCA